MTARTKFWYLISRTSEHHRNPEVVHRTILRDSPLGQGALHGRLLTPRQAAKTETALVGSRGHIAVPGTVLKADKQHLTVRIDYRVQVGVKLRRVSEAY